MSVSEQMHIIFNTWPWRPGNQFSISEAEWKLTLIFLAVVAGFSFIHIEQHFFQPDALFAAVSFISKVSASKNTVFTISFAC